MTPRLKTSVWVTSQTRLCDINCIPAYIIRKGDADAGVVLMKLIRKGGLVEVFAQTRTMDGRLGWLRGAGGGPVDEAAADDYIRRQVNFDPDIWVVEIEDPDGRYELDGEVVS
ncbi:MAG: DUF1491 family protein [Rhodospirillales bacterium]|nr:DUF1491 family protein [Rhodospirillales bacterium]MCW8860839.1 DUF1491 family protein [Rhodospirillales bacterium]MCW8951442.1 DUF1491 family protein [Rhodospirillales bacterium]MCW9001926.1 DUF1491 family protein [Rhodospirillales bacterium]MCW9039453.1 DUF1491 family protein [Rhodospirillales bacterium]